MSVINQIKKGSTVYDIQDQNAIENPSTKADKQVLTYDAASGKWIAQNTAPSGVMSVAAGDNSVTIGGSAANPTVAAKVSTQANNGLSVKNDGLYAAATDLSGVEGRLDTIEGKEAGWDAKYNKPSTGIPDTDITSATKWNAKQDAIPANTYDAYGAASSAEAAAKTYADGLSVNYATAAQGAKADSAIQSVTTGSANGAIAVDGSDVAVKGLKSAAYTESSAYDAAGSAATAKSEVIGVSGDASSASTIFGAKKYADEKIAGLGAFMEFKGTQTSESAIKALTSAKKGDVWLNTADGSEWVCTKNITSADATAWEKLGVEIDISGKADRATTLSGYGITDAYTKTETGTQITNAINALDVTDSAVSGKYVSAVSEADGKISVTRADLPDSASEVRPINLSTSWTGSAAPYTQTVNVSGITGNTIGIVSVDVTASTAQYKAAAKAQLRCTAQTNGQITMTAYGTKPTVEIPIAVTILKA